MLGVPKVEVIGAAAFAPFGTVLRHPGGGGRHYIDAAIADIEPEAGNSSVPEARNSPVPEARNSPVPEARNSPVPEARNSPVPEARARLWINRLEAAPPEILLDRIERHPFSPQTFVPMGAGRLLCAVCPALDRGDPDTDGLRLFLVPPGTGISYRRGTWHHGLISLDGPCGVVVLMGLCDGDTELFPLPHPLRIRRDALT